MAKGLVLVFCACSVVVGAGLDFGVKYRSEKSEHGGPSGVIKTGKSPFETVIYATHGGRELAMDIYRPKRCARSPAFLLLHGGGWVSGSKDDMRELAQYIASRGALAASAEYRFAPANRWPAQLEDVQAAVRYLRANAVMLNIEPKRIAAAGISAGGHLSLFLGSVDASHPTEHAGYSSRVEAVGSISGLHDLRLKMTRQGEAYGIVEALVGVRQGAAVDAASPILKLSTKSAPTYFIQGAIDPLVPPNQTAAAAKRLSDLGVREKAETVPGMGHGLTLRDKPQAAAFGRMIDWLLFQMK